MMAEPFDKNIVDLDEHPRTADLEQRCERMLAALDAPNHNTAPAPRRRPAPARRAKSTVVGIRSANDAEAGNRSFGAWSFAGTYGAGVTAAARRCMIVAVNTAAVAAVAASSRNPRA